MASDQKPGTAELLFNCALGMGLRPAWITPNGLLAISVEGQERYINLACSPLNSHLSISLAKNKYMTRRVMERHNMQNIPFTRPSTMEEAQAFLQLHDKIVAKPVTGAGARDIHVITQNAELQDLQINKYILERYIAGRELRYLLLNNEVIGVHRSDYGTSVEEHRPLRRISYPRPAWNPALIDTSLKIANILDLRFAAIDYLIDASGRTYILEVNTGPGLKWFHAPSSGPVIDVARLFLEAMLDDMRFEAPPNSDILASSTVKAYSES